MPHARASAAGTPLLTVWWCLIAASACQQPVRSTTAPGPVTGSQGVSSITLCHRTGSDVTFVLISVNAPEAPAHLAHGDGPIAELVPGQTDSRFDASCHAISMKLVSVTFEELASSSGPVTGYTEDGVGVDPIAGPWEAMTGYGQPAPALIFKQIGGNPALTGVLQITDADGLFSFVSVDLYSSVTTIPYTITGIRDGVTVFSMSATIPNTFGRFARVTSSAPSLVTELRIELTNPMLACCNNPMGLDNLTIRR